jgi:1,4-alpha-glucan branching enzyme
MAIAQAALVERLVRGELHDPHSLLGKHQLASGGAVIRAWRPEATTVGAVAEGTVLAKLEQVHPDGLFEATLDEDVDRYQLETEYPDGKSYVVNDPYAFPPTLGELDLHLLAEGSHRRLYERLGAHRQRHSQAINREGDGSIEGVAFAVWAPSARSVRVVGDFNGWDGRLNPMRSLGSSGVWELFVPGIDEGAHYKFELLSPDGRILLKTDPYAFSTETPPGTAARVFTSNYEFRDGDWMTRRRTTHHHMAPISVYEVHAGSWRCREDGRAMSYRELAQTLVPYVKEMGFTHVEFLPLAEHPFAGSWGYQVGNYFAPTSRFGSPDDFKHLVDRFHQEGLGVIVDWVPAHFPRDDYALAGFDGTALYEHEDPRQGAHPDWGTLIFNYGRREVRNFLISNALYWIEEFHVDGLRVDAVASMLYLDYSRKEGEWVPNRYGGNENLDAIDFLQELNTIVHDEHPGVLMKAEESTSFPGVSRPVHLGGLGFGFKWNMGWMHDTLDYFARDPIHRRYHHNQLTFSLMYAFSENFVLPLSHDEVVHGKGSLLNKMAGDPWRKFANLRAMFAYMWAHPGKQLLFMGGELAQWAEWNHERDLDWDALGDDRHAGVKDLVRDLNRLYKDNPALFERDSTHDGFAWIDANDSEQNVLSFFRSSDDDYLVCVANLSPLPRYGFRLGLPVSGVYAEVLNTDAESYGGSNVGNLGTITSEPVPSHGLDQSASVALPPLGVLWLRPVD